VCSFPDKVFNQKFPKRRQNLSYHRMDMVELRFILAIRNHIYSISLNKYILEISVLMCA